MRIDLHCHSTASDGTEAPAVVARRAAEAGLDLIALTDHDTVAGHGEAAAAGRVLGLEVALGCEVSCLRDGVSVHLLAYLFDPASEPLSTELELIRSDRRRRTADMVERLQALGAPVTYERVIALADDAASVGRPHVARALVEAGVVPDVPSAFTEQWIGAGGRAYVEKRALDPVAAVRLVREAGGVAVCAHPGAAKRGALIADALLEEMAGAGLAGLEVDHPDHDVPTKARLRDLARSLALVTTGSSDDHGALTGHRLGANTTAPQVWAALTESRGSGVSSGLSAPSESSGD